MEESRKKSQNKNHKKIYVMLAIFAVFAIGFIGLGASGTITNWVAKYQAEKNYEELIASASNVTDEMTLRQLLLLEKELEITVNKDMEIKTGFTVNGTKTLRGDSIISSNLGILRPISILDVTSDAKLIMDGLVLDGNGNAVGVKVQENAELTYLSGEITYAGTYGIAANGLVNIEDITITNCTAAAIDAGFLSKVYFNGGQLVDNRHIGIYVEGQGYLEMSDGAVIDGISGQGIRNRGKLVIHGGEFKNIDKFVVSNQKDLVIDYKGNKGDYLKVSDIGQGVVYNDKKATAKVKDVYATNMGQDAYKNVGGTLTLENCVVDGVKTHGLYTNAGQTTFKDVKIMKPGSCGVYASALAEVTLEDVVFEDAGSRGIMSSGADIIGKNITIDGSEKYGISNHKTADGEVGVIELTNLTSSSVKEHNIWSVSNDVKTIVKDSVLNEAGKTNVYIGAGEVSLENVEILGSSKVDAASISISKNGTCTVSGKSKIHGNGVRGVNISGIFNLKGGEIYGYSGEKFSGGAVRLYKGGVFNMSGGVIQNNRTKLAGGAVYLAEDTTFNMTGGKIQNNTAGTTGGAVHVTLNSTFNMKGGTIQGNKTVQASGGAVYILGKMHMNDGTIAKNTSASVGGAINLNSVTNSKIKEKVYGEFHMTGGTIKENSSTGNGGAIHISDGTTVTMSGGRITDNLSKKDGSGINQNGNFTMSGNAYVGNNVITLGSTKKVVKIAGASLGAHNAQNPLLIEPAFAAEKGTVVATCESAAISANVLGSTAPGNKAYASFAQKAENIIIGSYNENIDMNMAGADTVYVLNFQELKEAVESTTSKRCVVIGSNIVMEGVVTVPEGTTVYIKDDGTKRTLTREAENTSSFFRTSFGTGLYIAGTGEGNLVLDGKTSGKVDVDKVSQLVISRGATEISNVTMKDNETPKLTGAFVRHLYGSLNIENSTFDNAYANAGGAIASATGTANIINCTFTNNETKSGGGAVRLEKKASMTIEGSTFAENSADTVGGAINSDSAALVVKNTAFADNTSKGTSGAINLTNKSTATITDSAFDGNKSTADNAGAIKVNKSSLVLKGTTFVDNTTPKSGGAIFLEGKIDTNTYSNVIATGCTFKTNSADNTGGAIKGETGVVITLADSDFIQNTSKSTTGGAIDLYRSTVNATGCTFEKNTANTYGGAIYLNKEAVANLEDSDFIANESGKTGGAVYVLKEATLNVTGGKFQENKATTDGGAIFAKGETTVADAKFVSNSAKRAGAIWVEVGETNVSLKDTAFVTNTATNGTAGAIRVESGSHETVVMDNCSFDGNTASTYGDAIYVNADKSFTLKGGTFANADSDIEFSSTMGHINISGAIQGVTVMYSKVNHKGLVVDESGITGSDITITPKAYIKGHELVAKTEAASEATLKEAAKIIKVAENGDGLDWVIESDGTIDALGTLQTNVAQNKETEEKYTSIQAAVNAAKSGETIYVLYDMEVEKAISLSDGKNITITNAPGKNITMIRAFAGSLFTVKSGSTLTLGSTDVTNTFVVDGGYNKVSAPALVKNEGTFNLMSNATLQNAYTKGNSSNASNDGGALYNTGTANLAGNFTGNRAYNGGAVYNADGTLNITGGVYTANIGAGQGGAVYVGKNTDTATIVNATMTSNEVTNAYRRGGAIYLQGGNGASTELTLEGCNIYNNVTEGTKAADPGNDIIICNFTTLNIKNNISLGIVQQRWTDAATINVQGNTIGEMTLIPVSYEVEKVLVNFETDATAKLAGNIVIREAKEVTNGENTVLEFDEDTYYIDDQGYLQYKNAKIGETAYNTIQDAINAVESGKQETTVVEVLYDASISEAVTIKGNKNVTITNAAGSDITLTRAFKGTLFTVENGSTLTLGSVDTANTFVVDGGSDVSTSLVNNAGTFNLAANTTLQNANAGTSTSTSGTSYGGALYNTGIANLAGNFVGNRGYNGGAVYNADGTLNITSGTYSGNIGAGQGGAIYVGKNTDTATIANATMTSNEVTNASRRGGAIYLQGGNGASTELTLERCNIYDNVTEGTKAVDPGNDIIICNFTTLNIKNNINLGIVQQRWTDAATINVQGETIGDMTLIPVSYEVNKALVSLKTDAVAALVGEIVIREVSEVTEGDKKVLAYTDNKYYVDNDGYLQIYNAKIGDTVYKTLQEALTAAKSGDTVTIVSDATISDTVSVSNKTLTIAAAEGKSVTITRAKNFAKEMFNIAADGNLTITGAITVDGGYDVSANTGVVTDTLSIVENSGKFTLGTSATLTGGNAGTGNAAENIGGALFNASGAEAILYGNVSKNTAYKGGAVYNRGTLTIKGGTYEYNEAANNGATFYNNGGELNIEAGIFQYNEGGAAGAVVYSNPINKDGALKIFGGTFDSNTILGGNGCVIYCSSKTLQITGGTFTNNTAVAGGGVIQVATTGATISGVKMYNNILTTGGTGGGAIYIGSGKDVTISDSEIYGNTTSDNANKKYDICVHKNGTLNVSGGINTSNETANQECIVYKDKDAKVSYIQKDGVTLGTSSNKN